jgi:hypothetical protein
MTRLLLAVALAVLAGCAEPVQTTMQPAPTPPPAAPQILHRIVLTGPPGGQGALEIRRQLTDGGEAAAYTASGAIVVADDVGNWRFAYTKTSLEGAGLVQGEWINGLHALSMVVTNTSQSDVEIDWEHSWFVDPTGRTHKIVHRGVQMNQLTAPMVPTRIAAGATLNEFIFPRGNVTFSAPGGRASLWNAPAVFERLVPGSGFSLVLAITRGAAAAPRTFTFSAVGAPA